MLRTLYEEHWQVVLNYAARLLLQDHHGAADVTQEVFLRAWRHAEVFTQGPGYTRAWLLTVARNLIVDRHRARGARAPEVSDAALRTGSGPAAPDHADWVAASVTVAHRLDTVVPGSPRSAARGVLERAQREGSRGRHRNLCRHREIPNALCNTAPA